MRDDAGGHISQTKTSERVPDYFLIHFLLLAPAVPIIKVEDMSRDIFIGYRMPDGSQEASIEVRAPYFLFGTQQTSKKFWSLPIWRAIGVTRLAELGDTDPIYFIGWEMIDDLAREIRMFADNFESIDFDADVKSWFLAHLVYCHSLLVATAPKDSIPELTIG